MFAYLPKEVKKKAMERIGSLSKNGTISAKNQSAYIKHLVAKDLKIKTLRA